MAKPTADQAFRNLLQVLMDVQASAWQREEEKSSKYAELRVNVSRTLQRYLNQKLNFQVNPLKPVTQCQLISLPPLQKDTHLVPFLTLLYDGNGGNDSCCRLYVLLLGFNRNIDRRNQVYGIGFRIESPEINCQEHADNDDNHFGAHDFYHAQFISNLNKYGWPEIYRTYSQLPESQPSFPLWATCPFDALLNLILTLYGAKYYSQFLKEHGQSVREAMSDEFKLLNNKLEHHGK